MQRWLDGNKRIRRQIGTTSALWLGVRFWVEEPARLEASTRRLMCLQLRRLLNDGRLQAPRPARLLLASYQAQGLTLSILKLIIKPLYYHL